MAAAANLLLLEFVEQNTVVERGETRDYVALPVRCRMVVHRSVWRERERERVDAPRESNRRALPLGTNRYGHVIVALVVRIKRMYAGLACVEFVVDVRNSRPL